MRTISRLLVLLLPILGSGCVHVEPQADPVLQSFEATYATPAGKRMVVEFDGPTMVADRDLARREAYALTVTAEAGALAGSDGPFIAAYYLDSEFSVVRVDVFCEQASAGEPCDSRVRSVWTVQGSPPPLGFFWPRHAGADLPVLGKEVPWTGTLAQEGDTLVARQGESPFQTVLLDGTGPYTYADSLAVHPSRIEGTATGRQPQALSLELQQIRFGAELPEVPRWPKALHQGRPASDPPATFLGEGEPVLGQNYTTLDALGQLRRLSQTADHALATGCVVGVDIQPYSAGTSSAMDVDNGILGYTWSKVTFHVSDGAGPAKDYEVRHRSANLLEPEAWEVTETSNQRPASCGSKWSVGTETSVPEFLALVDSLGVPNATINAYGAVWSPRPSLRSAVGEATYFAAPFPLEERQQDGFRVTNQVYFLPGPGWMDSSYLPAETVVRMDGR